MTNINNSSKFFVNDLIYKLIINSITNKDAELRIVHSYFTARLICIGFFQT